MDSKARSSAGKAGAKRANASVGEKITAGPGCALQRQAVRKDGFTAGKRRAFLNTLAATCNVSAAARACRMAITSCYRLRARDSVFAEAWQAALTMGYERLEQALLDYALSRVEAQEIDPEDADRAEIEGSLVVALEKRTVSAADLQFALALLNRHRAAAEGRGLAMRGARRATAEEPTRRCAVSSTRLHAR